MVIQSNYWLLHVLNILFQGTIVIFHSWFVISYSTETNYSRVSYLIFVVPYQTKGSVWKIMWCFPLLIHVRINGFYWNYNSFKTQAHINPSVLRGQVWQISVVLTEAMLAPHKECQEIIAICEVCMNTYVSLCVLLCMHVHQHAFAQPCHWRQAVCSLWRAFCWVGAHTKQLQTTAP